MPTSRTTKARPTAFAAQTGLSVSDLHGLKDKALQFWRVTGAHATPTIQEALFRALQQLPRSRLIRSVFSDGQSQSSVEQSSFYGYSVVSPPQRTRRTSGRRRLAIDDAEVVRAYDRLLVDLQAMRVVLRQRPAVSVAQLAAALSRYLEGAAQWVTVVESRCGAADDGGDAGSERYFA